MITGPREWLKRAGKLRSEMSLPEELLGRELRKRPGVLKFRRQHPADIYVLDFYCSAARLDNEIDGMAQDNARIAVGDDARSHYLRSQNVAVLRVPAKVVLKDIDRAVTRIVEVCRQRTQRLSSVAHVPLHHPADGPPPRWWRIYDRNRLRQDQPRAPCPPAARGWLS